MSDITEKRIKELESRITDKEPTNKLLFDAFGNQPLRYGVVAAIIKTNRATIYRIIYNGHQPRQSTINKLTEFFGKTEAELGFGGAK